MRRGGFLALFTLAGCLSVPPAGDTEGESSGATTTSVGTDATAQGTGTSTTVGTGSATTQMSTSRPPGSTGPEPTDGTGGEGVLDVDGELIEVPPGWQGGVWFDFSDPYVFDDNAYPDDEYVFNNAPQSMFILSPPFTEGLGVITVHTIIELQDGGTYSERNFFQAAGQDGPDALWQAVDCSGWNGQPARTYCVNAGSQGGGDGIFSISAQWEMSLVETINNCNYLGFDPQGEFTGVGDPALIYGTPNDSVVYPSQVVITGRSQPRWVTAAGELVAILNEIDLQRLVLVRPGTLDLNVLRSEILPAEPIARQNAGALRIATGDVTGLPWELYVLVQASELYGYNADGASELRARTVDGRGWRWASVVIPDSGHTLSRNGRPTFYILESNRDLDRDRVIWLQPQDQ